MIIYTPTSEQPNSEGAGKVFKKKRRKITERSDYDRVLSPKHTARVFKAAKKQPY